MVVDFDWDVEDSEMIGDGVLLRGGNDKESSKGRLVDLQDA